MSIDLVDLLDFVLDALLFFGPGATSRKGVSFPNDFQVPPMEGKPFSGALPGWQIKPLRVTPVATGTLRASAESGIGFTGTWQLTPGSLHARCDVPTQFEMIEGHLTIAIEHGDTFSPLPGQTFRIEAGTAATWEVQSLAVLRFALAEV